MSKVFITKSKFKEIISGYELNENAHKKDIYKQEIYFFSEKEKDLLRAAETFLRDPEEFIKSFQKKTFIPDPEVMVYPPTNIKSYHISSQCDRLTQPYHNWELPSFAKNNDNTVHFRDWFAKYQHLDVNSSLFLKEMSQRFGKSEELKSVKHNPKGVVDVWSSVAEGEKKIDEIIQESKRYYVNNKGEQNAIKLWQKRTSVIYLPDYEKIVKEGNIEKPCGLSDSELLEFLRKYERTFKTPAKDALLAYYRSKHNTELAFPLHILGKLGFVPCQSCKNGVNAKTFDSPTSKIEKPNTQNYSSNSSNEDLPF